MELSKKDIEGLRFTLMRRKFYLATEVDQALDTLAELAESNERELASLRQRIDALERMSKESNVIDSTLTIQQANQKARDILQQAMHESDTILLDITNQRNRVIAASRTAYYNALQFKQEVAQQYRQLEQDMDSAIDVLRVLEGTQGSGVGGSTPVSIFGGTVDKTGESGAQS